MKLLQGLGLLFYRLGLFLIGVSSITMAVVVWTLFLPSGALHEVFVDLAARFGFEPRYAAFEPDETVRDEALGAEVPRLYDLLIPRLGLHAPIVAVSYQAVEVQGREVRQLHVPNAFAVGWSEASAPVGAAGNTVLVGHNNEFGEVFKGLWELQPGDAVVVQTASGERRYRVSEVASFEERGQPLTQRFDNAAWLEATPDERLTLITCWPYVTNTHRIVVVALPE